MRQFKHPHKSICEKKIMTFKPFHRLALGAAVAASAFVLVSPQTAFASGVDNTARPIINEASGKCLEVVPTNGDYLRDGNLIQQRTCDGSPQQSWRFVMLQSDPDIHYVFNDYTHKCLDNTDGSQSNGTAVQQWDCSTARTSTTMQWIPTGLSYRADDHRLRYNFKNKRSGKCLDVRGGSLQDGALLQQNQCTFGDEAEVFLLASAP
ncbi:RICIN domain-containing protein [Streptomyces sp900105245]|uniref:RICIN domain-containing protein n=1 Tax=Streptomyces sp. 900105245 TaxID=3154379 RepID=A0ABV1ULI0_9ACTN